MQTESSNAREFLCHELCVHEHGGQFELLMRLLIALLFVLFLYITR
jgi:hypothetical protein